MSTLFVEHLRKTLDARDGFLHVVRAEPGGPLKQAPFTVMFARLDAPGGFMQPHYCQGLADLTQFLRQLGLAKRASESIQSALKSRESVSERLTLTQDQIALF